MSKRLLEKDTPFDQFDRQIQVRAILDKLRTADPNTFTILDVGGYRGRTSEFLKFDDVTVLDVFDVKDEKYVKGTALDIPFEDSSFDFVVSYDVLEHIASPDRTRFIEECSRVSKRGFIICAPQNTETNNLAEYSLNNYYYRLHHKPHPWLREHIENGLPDFNEVEEYAHTKGYLTSVFMSNKIQLWTAMQQAIFLNSKYPMASEQLTKVNEFYNVHTVQQKDVSKEEAYRLILCCLKRQDEHAKVQKLATRGEKVSCDIEFEIKLYEALAEYNRTILQKTSTLAAQYKKLYTFERKRADALAASHEKVDKGKENRRIGSSHILIKLPKRAVRQKGGKK